MRQSVLDHKSSRELEDFEEPIASTMVALDGDTYLSYSRPGTRVEGEGARWIFSDGAWGWTDHHRLGGQDGVDEKVTSLRLSELDLDAPNGISKQVLEQQVMETLRRLGAEVEEP